MKDNENANSNDIQENIIETNDEDADTSEINEENYTGVFLPIGIALGVSLGIVFDNLAIGISLGVAFGLGIGTVIEHSKSDKTFMMIFG